MLSMGSWGAERPRRSPRANPPAPSAPTPSLRFGDRLTRINRREGVGAEGAGGLCSWGLGGRSRALRRLTRIERAPRGMPARVGATVGRVADHVRSGPPNRAPRPPTAGDWIPHDAH